MNKNKIPHKTISKNWQPSQTNHKAPDPNCAFMENLGAQWGPAAPPMDSEGFLHFPL